jgi:hypothetical protein
MFCENKLGACIGEIPVLSALSRDTKIVTWKLSQLGKGLLIKLIIETISDLNNVLQNDLASDKPLKQC